jgi:hypothetical protein
MAKRTIKAEKPVPPLSQTGVVVGWTHHDLGSSIDLRIQSAQSQQALDSNNVDNHHFLMTHNQALLLAKYLLDVTGQSLPPRSKPTLWQRLAARGTNKA